MTTRTPGRHRAAHSPITPLTPITRAAAHGIATTARRGAVVAAGSGLLVALLGTSAAAAPAPGDRDTKTAEFETGAWAAQPAVLGQEALGQEATVQNTLRELLDQETLQQATLQAAPQEGRVQEVRAQNAEQQVTVAPAVRVAADSALGIETGTIKVTPAPEPEPEPEPVVEVAEEVAVADEPAAAQPAAEEPAAQPAVAAESTAPAATGGSDIIAIAERYLGVPYVWGGSTPAGFDCSGFTSYVYAQIGIDLPRTSSEQRYAGTVVSRAEAQPGDLIWSPGHIALYAGGDRQIEAPVPGQTVHYSSIWQSSPIFIRVR